MFINSTTSGKRFQVDVSADETVRTLKNQITDEVGVPYQHMQLNFRGTEMKDNSATLASYGIDPSNAEVLTRTPRWQSPLIVM